MTSRKSRLHALVVAITLFSSGAALGADPGNNPPANPSPEARRQMVIHEKMAACLKTDRPMAECRAEMLKNCQDMMGKNGCPMMGSMGGGMMRGPGMMQGGSSKEGSPK